MFLNKRAAGGYTPKEHLEKSLVEAVCMYSLYKTHRKAMYFIWPSHQGISFSLWTVPVLGALQPKGFCSMRAPSALQATTITQPLQGYDQGKNQCGHTTTLQAIDGDIVRALEMSRFCLVHGFLLLTVHELHDPKSRHGRTVLGYLSP